jgi:hypothetical protein
LVGKRRRRASDCETESFNHIVGQPLPISLPAGSSA